VYGRRSLEIAARRGDLRLRIPATSFQRGALYGWRA
jgi:hypothetical protein